MQEPQISVKELIGIPYDLWTYEVLLERTEDQAIPFQTTMHRGMVSLYLIQNELVIKKAYSDLIEPIILIQDTIKVQLLNKEIGLDSVVKADVTGMVRYIEVLKNASWPLPIEGFLDTAMIDTLDLKCYGQFELIILQSDSLQNRNE